MTSCSRYHSESPQRHAAAVSYRSAAFTNATTRRKSCVVVVASGRRRQPAAAADSSMGISDDTTTPMSSLAYPSESNTVISPADPRLTAVRPQSAYNLRLLTIRQVCRGTSALCVYHARRLRCSLGSRTLFILKCNFGLKFSSKISPYHNHDKTCEIKVK